ncbi:MAG: hypothetical protein ACTSWN_05060 [Promethearchaeota archaeon]
MMKKSEHVTTWIQLKCNQMPVHHPKDANHTGTAMVRPALHVIAAQPSVTASIYNRVKIKENNPCHPCKNQDEI